MVELAAIVDLLRTTGIGLAGTATMAAVVAVLLSAGYRAVTTRSPLSGAVGLLALAVVSTYLTVTLVTTGQVLEGVPADHHYSAGYLLATVLLAGTTAVTCRRLGDRAACQVVGLSRIDADGDQADALRAARLAVACDLPTSIDRLAGSRPVDPETLESISGSTVHLPHGLSASDRRSRLESHLESAFAVDVASVELAADGTVDRVAVGTRATGLGSLVPPERVAVAVRTTSPPAGGRGDPVDCWSTGEETRLVATGTLHSSDDAVATVLVDRDRVDDLSMGDRYRLVTGPEEPTDGYALAGMLRTVDERVLTWTVEDDGPLAGEFVGWLPGRVLVVSRGEDLLALPADSETLHPGDRLWMLAAPDALSAFDRGRDEPESSTVADDDRIDRDRRHDRTDRDPDVEPTTTDTR